MKYFVLSILLILSSCGLKQMDVDIHSASDGVWYGPSYGKHMSGTCYALGLDYPKGCDWKADSQNEDLNSSLVMFADGIPVLRMQTGESYEVSSEFARHRIRNGRLYSDYTDGLSTVIKEDGKVRVRYEGSEEIACLDVYDGRIYTLGYPVGGGGFVYRVDGESVLQRDDAVLYPHLDFYAGMASFCFSVNVRETDGYRQCHYRATDGKVYQVDSDPGIIKVWDMRVVSGKLYMAVSLQDRAPVLLYDDVSESVDYFNKMNLVSCTFCDSDRICLNSRFRHSGSYLMSDILWMGGDEWIIYRLGSTLSSVFVDKDGYNSVINPSDGRDGYIFDGNMAYVIPEGYSISSKDCMTRKEGVLHVGLSSSIGGEPVIWRPDRLDTLDMNGPLICLR